MRSSGETLMRFGAAQMRTLRCLSTPSNSEVFDRSLKRRHKVFSLNYLPDATYFDYLRKESAHRLMDRLDDITKSFPTAVELGSYRSTIYEIVAQSKLDTISGDNPHIRGSIGGIQTLIQCDSCVLDKSKMIHLENFKETLPYHRIVCDEEFLPFPENSVDLVLSNMSMHWVNDLPQALHNIHSVLRPDGAFICSMLGGNTLKELRHCFYLAEQERRGGMSPHTSPLALPSDIAGLMQAAKFALPTIDVDTIQITYPDAFSLMEHIFKMGEGSAAFNRQYAVGRDTFIAMASIYQALYGVEEDGSVCATFEFINMIGWKPDASQPKACKRGSAQVSMKDIPPK